MSDPIKTLSKYRLDKAKEELASAQILFEGELYNQALNRAYYSIFHGMRAVLALDQFDSKKHSGIIAEFNLRYVKTGIFDKKYGRIITHIDTLTRAMVLLRKTHRSRLEKPKAKAFSHKGKPWPFCFWV